jgi:hypothetical protein
MCWQPVTKLLMVINDLFHPTISSVQVWGDVTFIVFADAHVSTLTLCWNQEAKVLITQRPGSRFPLMLIELSCQFQAWCDA